MGSIHEFWGTNCLSKECPGVIARVVTGEAEDVCTFVVFASNS